MSAEVKVTYKTKACPFCGEQILAAAIKCKHCQTMLDGSAPEVQIRPKKAGRITLLGWVGAVLGGILLCLCGWVLYAFDNVNYTNIALWAMLGVALLFGSLEWARR